MLRWCGKNFWINLDHVSCVIFFKDEEDGGLRKARVYFLKREEPIILTVLETQYLSHILERNTEKPCLTN